MKKILRIILVWTLVSLLLQFGAYSFLNKQVASVLAPNTGVPNEPIIRNLTATIPGSDLKNIQISYAKDYLAYTENGVLKVFNLTKERIVFEKKLPSTNDTTMGVLTYQWLPDRDTLLYFYAKKNPNPVSYVTLKYDLATQTQITPVTTAPTQPDLEDPNQNAQVPVVVPREVPVQPKVEKRYNNPQITELYTLELPSSDEDTAPDDRFNKTIDSFPAGGKIGELVVSTSTNLIYLTVKNVSTELLMEIDVMKNVRTINRAGETIDGMDASNRFGTLYINSKIGGTRQVVALGTDKKRLVISNNSNDRVLGLRDGKVYIGEINDNQLIKIKTTSDSLELTNNPQLKTEWEGSIPFKNSRTIVGSKGQVIVYNQMNAYNVTAAQLKQIQLSGEENYISNDGAVLIQLNRSGTSTLLELSPIKF